MIIFCAGINLMIAVMNQSGLGNLFGEIIISLIGESRNLYVITAIVCIGASTVRALREQYGLCRHAGPGGHLHR